MSALKGKTYNLKRYSLVAIVIGIPIIYLGGAIQLHFVTEMPWAAVITSGVLPFIPLDIVKSILAAILAKPLLNIIAIRNTQP